MTPAGMERAPVNTQVKAAILAEDFLAQGLKKGEAAVMIVFSEPIKEFVLNPSNAASLGLMIVNAAGAANNVNRIKQAERTEKPPES